MAGARGSWPWSGKRTTASNSARRRAFRNGYRAPARMSGSPRGNRWVLQLALSEGAPKVSLIAVWDGNAVGDSKGGTAHIVQIGRAAGTVDVHVINISKTVRWLRP